MSLAESFSLPEPCVPRKVILVGTLAPWEGDVEHDAAIWSCNHAYRRQPNVSRLYWFDPELLDDHEWIKEVRQLGIPVFGRERHPGLPLSRPYPLRQVIERFGLCYFNSTMPYIIAHAILEGVREIHVHRVNAIMGSQDYYHQKTCISTWLGIAAGMGVTVTLSNDCGLMATDPWESPLYGYMRKRNESVGHFMMSTTIKGCAQLACDPLFMDLPDDLPNHPVVAKLKERWHG